MVQISRVQVSDAGLMSGSEFIVLQALAFDDSLHELFSPPDDGERFAEAGASKCHDVRTLVTALMAVVPDVGIEQECRPAESDFPAG